MFASLSEYSRFALFVQSVVYGYMDISVVYGYGHKCICKCI